jgi:hypothetical protein
MCSRSFLQVNKGKYKMKKIPYSLIMFIGLVFACDSESTTIVEGGEYGGQTSIGGQTNGGTSFTGGSSNQSVAGNSQVSGGNSATQSNSGGQTNSGSSAITQCTPKTCQAAMETILQSSNAVNATGQLIDWDNVSLTACGDMSDGCGNVINCGACNTCGQASGLGTYAPSKGIIGVCGETMCLSVTNDRGDLCVGTNTGKGSWYCGSGNAVGPKTESGCVPIANPSSSGTQTYFCCDK